jgi:hypothetical protein
MTLTMPIVFYILLKHERKDQEIAQQYTAAYITHCVPWQIVTAMAFGGSTTFNPLTDTLQGMLEMKDIGQ